ncbi:MAG: L-rhamnose mutarotase [Cyclobacteriaceae bacterium]|nr:L-rhamnose mutarotase [Cyclobacteriaceae bacterium]
MPQTFALALDLKDDAALIADYERYHRQIPEAIRASLTESGILRMEIYRWQNRLFMVMVTTDSFSFENKVRLDSDNPDVQAWEELMWRFQQPLPGTKPGEKWQLMSRIFELNA